MTDVAIDRRGVRFFLGRVSVQPPHVVSFNGEFDIWMEDEVEFRLSAFDGSSPAIVDLSNVRYLDSAFLSALVRLRRRLPRCPITVVVAAPAVRRLFDLTEMNLLFQITSALPPI